MSSILLLPLTLFGNEKGTPDEGLPSVSEEEQTLNDQGFSISLNLYNPVTSIPQTTFFFGDEVGYEVTLNIPPTAEGKKTTVTLTASVKVGGVVMPFTASNVFSGPMLNPTYKKDNGDIFEPRIWNGKFKLPNDIPVPGITATVKLVVTIKDIGTSTISSTITLKTKRTLPKPTLIYPQEGASLNPISCGKPLYRTCSYFVWNEVPWATKYKIAINDAFNGSAITYSTENNYYYSCTQCTDTNHKAWTWKVRAGNEYCWSAWSETRHFTVNY